ncbi:MAG: Sbal_3080 family lipoprotein [Opitutaceae bacterium]
MKIRTITSLLLVSLLSGCAISKNVQSVDSSVEINKIYVKDNPKVLMEGLLPELLTQINTLGFESESYSENKPANARYYMTYTANWQWDMAMYLTYFRGTLYDNGRVLGEAEYDAKMGGANMNKFGPTAEKVRPLLSEMLANVKRSGNSTVAPLGN